MSEYSRGNRGHSRGKPRRGWSNSSPREHGHRRGNNDEVRSSQDRYYTTGRHGTSHNDGSQTPLYGQGSSSQFRSGKYRTGDRRGRGKAKLSFRHGTYTHEGQTHNREKAEATNSRAATTTVGLDSDIPGFYYDAATKKYFKITTGSHQYSVDNVREMAKEKAAAANDLAFSTIKLKPTKSKMRNAPLPSLVRPLPHAMQSVPFPCGKLPVPSLYAQRRQDESGIRSCIPISQLNQSRIASVGRLLAESSDETRQILYQTHSVIDTMAVNNDDMTIACATRSGAITALQIHEKDDRFVVDHVWNLHSGFQVSSVRWCPEPGSSSVLAAVGPALWDNPSTCMIVDVGRSPQVQSMRALEKENEALWSCAWVPGFSDRLLIGGAGRAHLFDYTRERTVGTFKCGKSDIFVTESNATRNHAFFCGQRNGHIQLIDVRCSGYTTVAKLGSSVLSILPLRDGASVIVACMDGKLQTWDSRNWRSPVIEFTGHYNEHTRADIYVDRSETLLCAGGQDKRVRLWDVRTGIAIANVVSLKGNLVPSVAFEIEWGRENIKSRRPALFAVHGNELSVHHL